MLLNPKREALGGQASLGEAAAPAPAAPRTLRSRPCGASSAKGVPGRAGLLG